MFAEGQKVSVIGKFTVANTQDDFVEMDPWEKGETDSLAKYNEDGFYEMTAEGHQKDFDGFQKGDFFAFNGTYEVERSNAVYTKVKAGKMLISIPNSKLLEVE